jgi:hypothetical protein
MPESIYKNIFPACHLPILGTNFVRALIDTIQALLRRRLGIITFLGVKSTTTSNLKGGTNTSNEH